MRQKFHFICTDIIMTQLYLFITIKVRFLCCESLVPKYNIKYCSNQDQVKFTVINFEVSWCAPISASSWKFDFIWKRKNLGRKSPDQNLHTGKHHEIRKTVKNKLQVRTTLRHFFPCSNCTRNKHLLI